MVKAFKPYPKEDLTGLGDHKKMTVKNVNNTKEVVKDLEELSEMGFTKQSTSKNRKKDDPYANIGL